MIALMSGAAMTFVAVVVVVAAVAGLMSLVLARADTAKARSIEIKAAAIGPDVIVKTMRTTVGILQWFLFLIGLIIIALFLWFG